MSDASRSIQRLRGDWDTLAQHDAFWAVLTEPGTRGNQWDVEAFFQRGREEVEQLLQRLRQKPAFIDRRLQGNALDFGCGVGRLSQALALHFDHVTGIDISEHMLSLAQQHNRHGERVRYLLNIADDLSLLGDERFDFIYTSITLQHMPPDMQLRYIAELARVLRTPSTDSPTSPTPASRAVPARPSPPTGGVLVLGIVTRLGGGAGPAWKRVVRRVVPDRWRYALHRLRGRWGGDALAGRMQMHAVPLAKVEHVLHHAGLAVLDVWDSGAAGEGYESKIVVAGHRVADA